MTNRLNDLQLLLLSHAARNDERNLIPLPDSCTDVVRNDKAIATLRRRGLIEERPVTERRLRWREQDDQHLGLFITGTGMAAIGVGVDGVRDCQTDNEAAQTRSASSPDGGYQPRPGSKTATLITLLQRDGGATLDELVAAIGWLPHTTRAALTGLRKKGHTIIRSKRGDVSCYHLASGGAV